MTPEEIAMTKRLTKSTRLLLTLACICAGFVANMAQASFHLVQVNEIYSNADGTVQFVELKVTSDGQNFFAGHPLTSTGSAAKSFNVTTNLSSSTTANKTVLFATQGFASLGIVTPDYIIPAGFLTAAGGSVSWAGVDTVIYTALPTNNQSVNRSGVAQTASPTNFAGATGTILASFNPESGFWYNPAEGGRGYVIEIHGSTLFIGGFMYDALGNAIWYASGPAAMTGTTVYTNSWQQYGNGQTLTGTFKPSAVITPNVGALTIQFTSATAGTLTLPTGTQIPIVRFPF